MEFSNDDKLKAFLKLESKRLGISINNTYSTYFARLLLERISKYSYRELYVKGSFSLLANLEEMIRPVTDIDLVSTKYHNDPLLFLYEAMYETNNDIFYELVDIPKQTKTGIYKLHLCANIGKIKHPISVDFQELSKTIYERDYRRVTPIFSGDDFFYIYTPSYEEHLAEKLCIILESNKSDVLNTRVKDFYDIYKLYNGKYNKEKLSYFFSHMLEDRGKIDVHLANTDFLDSEYINKHQLLWDSMSKKYEFMDKKVDFLTSFNLTKDILDKELENIETSKKIKIKLM